MKFFLYHYFPSVYFLSADSICARDRPFISIENESNQERREKHSRLTSENWHGLISKLAFNRYAVEKKSVVRDHKNDIKFNKTQIQNKFNNFEWFCYAIESKQRKQKDPIANFKIREKPFRLDNCTFFYSLLLEINHFVIFHFSTAKNDAKIIIH